MMNDSILLIQPRHIYAPIDPKHQYGHIYLPTSLLAAATIFLELDIDVEFCDENITPVELNNNFLGLNLLGAPYIPSAITFEKKLKKQFDNDFTLLLGGQIVSGLSELDFQKLFSTNVVDGNSYKNLSKILNIEENKIPKIETLSMSKAFSLIPDEIFKLYLQKEISFYLSQGCKHSCSFCSAIRSHYIDGKLIKEKETYRDIDIALHDFEYLIKKANKHRIYSLDVYLSNLDLFQSPNLLFLFAQGLNELLVKYPRFKLRLRGLTTVNSFLTAHSHYSDVINEIVKAGLYQIGFGIDGATAEVYKATRKPQTVQNCLDAIRICREAYDINPETLMVFGHNGKENEKSLQDAVRFCMDMKKQYNAYARPHIAKDIVPGNDGWRNKNNNKIKSQFYNNPILFQNLDFTAAPSPLTHPNKHFRELVTKYYVDICSIGNSLTQYVLPIIPDMNTKELEKVYTHNLGRYDL